MSDRVRLEDFTCRCCGGVWKVRVGPTKMAVVGLDGWCRRCNWGRCSREEGNPIGGRCNEGKKRQP
jgi:hypothetical protein